MAEPQVIADHDEVLNRQIPLGLWDAHEDRPMWAAFRPQTRDEGLLSTLRGRVGPEEAYRRYCSDPHMKSAGTWGICVGDAAGQGVACFDDGGLETNPPDHASADFRPLASAQRRAVAVELHSLSSPLYRPDPGA